MSIKTRTHRNKNELIANREHQPAYKEKTRKQAFGIYRPLTEKSAKEVGEAMANATFELTDYLRKERGTAPIAPLHMHLSYGITFVERGKVSKRMARGMLQHGFSLGRMIENAERHVGTEPIELEIPLDGFGWFGKNRTLVARLGTSDGLDELYDEAPIVENMLEVARAPSFDVQDPNHVSLFKYGRFGDNSDLSMYQRKGIQELIGSHFAAAGVGSIALAGLVVGDSYAQSKELL